MVKPVKSNSDIGAGADGVLEFTAFGVFGALGARIGARLGACLGDGVVFAVDGIVTDGIFLFLLFFGCFQTFIFGI